MTANLSNVQTDGHHIKRSRISIDCENKLKKTMEDENCKLLTPYKAWNKPVEYEYEGMPYKVCPTKWNQGARPHKAKCIRYTQCYVEKLFEKENCKLQNEYKNIFTMLIYQYNGEIYRVRLNEWLYIKARPHLEKVILDYPVPSNVGMTYEQQEPIE